MQRPTPGRDLIDLHVVGAGLVLLRHQINAGSHGGGHRRTKDAALRKSRPFAALVNVMHQRQFPLAVQSLGYGAAHGRNRAKTVIGKIGAVGGIYTDQRKPPLSGHTKSARPEGWTQINKLEFSNALFVINSLNFENYRTCTIRAASNHFIFVLHPAFHDRTALQTCIDVS